MLDIICTFVGNYYKYVFNLPFANKMTVGFVKRFYQSVFSHTRTWKCKAKFNPVTGIVSIHKKGESRYWIDMNNPIPETVCENT